MAQTRPQLEFCPLRCGFHLRPSAYLVERGARPFDPYPGDLENADLFNIRSQEFDWPELSANEFREFVMFIAHNLFIEADAKLTVDAMTYAALVRMEGADNIAPERVADALYALQRAAR